MPRHPPRALFCLTGNIFVYLVILVLLQSLGFAGGGKEIRTLDPLRARQVLSQLSYTPMVMTFLFNINDLCLLSELNVSSSSPIWGSLRKEVIQPHLPIRLPCYDFTPVTDPTFDCCFHKVCSQASGIANSHGVTGGVYKTRERIHRDILIHDY